MTEHQNTEYKTLWKDEYLKWICGFANTNGGKLYIGVKDDGGIIGIDNSKELLEQLPNKLRDLLGIYAEINLLEHNGLHYLEIRVVQHEIPISYKGKYYLRSGSTLQELKGTTLNEFILKKMGRSWDAVIEPEFSINDIDSKTIERFKMLAADRLPFIHSENSDSAVLEKLNLSEVGKLKRAAILLFGKDTQKFFLQARVKIGLFVSDTDLVSTDLVEGNLFQQMEQTLEILRTKYLLSPISYEGVHRREKLEIPFEALREAVINALIHRVYSTTSSIQIRITEQVLEIMNECNMSDIINIQDLKKSHLSKPQNRLLADTFYKAGLIESWGRGTLKIIDDCVKAGLKEPEFTTTDHYFSILFHRVNENSQKIHNKPTDKPTDKPAKSTSKPTSKPTGKPTGKPTDKPTDKLSDNQAGIIGLIAENPYITSKELSLRLEIRADSVRNNITKLKAKGLLERIGSARGGYWKITKKNNK